MRLLMHDAQLLRSTPSAICGIGPDQPSQPKAPPTGNRPITLRLDARYMTSAMIRTAVMPLMTALQ